MQDQPILEAMFSEATLGVLIADRDGIIVKINPFCEQLFGYDKKELIGQPVEILVPDTYRVGHHKHREQYHQNPKPRVMGAGRDLYGRRKDNTTFPIEISLSSTHIDGQQYVVAFISNILERKRITEALQESQSRLSAIINTAVDGIITINKEGIIESVNPAAANLFGYQPEEIIGLNIKKLMPEPDKTKHDSYLHNYHSSGINKIIGIGREVAGKRKDGSTFPFNLSVNETKLKSGTIYTGILHDLTKQKLAEEKLNNYAIELENKVKERTKKLAKNEQQLKKALKKEIELGELKSRFVSMASHEFRTPLSSIRSSAELIEMYPETEQQNKREKHIQRIISSVQNLTSILNDFLSLEKLETGNVNFQTQIFDLPPYLEEILEDLRLLTKEGQEIQLQFSGGSQVNTDPHLLRNILFNLISNAIKYSPINKTVDLVINNEEKFLIIEVKDYGIGIPEEDQQHLFTRFFRANNATNIKGTGLGLNIVQRYLNLMNGKVTFTSKLDEGTTFLVTIPQ